MVEVQILNLRRGYPPPCVSRIWHGVTPSMSEEAGIGLHPQAVTNGKLVGEVASHCHARHKADRNP